jgi:hypothetical protein
MFDIAILYSLTIDQKPIISLEMILEILSRGAKESCLPVGEQKITNETESTSLS